MEVSVVFPWEMGNEKKKKHEKLSSELRKFKHFIIMRNLDHVLK